MCYCVTVLPPSPQAGSVLGENLELLLRAVLSKMHSVQTPSVMQSLIIVFAHLMQTEVTCFESICRYVLREITGLTSWSLLFHFCHKFLIQKASRRSTLS